MFPDAADNCHTIDVGDDRSGAGVTKSVEQLVLPVDPVRVTQQVLG